MKKWIIIVLALALVFFLFYVWFFNQPCDPPQKPDVVPKAAIWSGGCDGGNWIELVEVKEEKYRFRIYRDWDGELQMDADFKFKKGTDYNLTYSNWTEVVCCYSSSLDSLMTLSVVSDDEKEKDRIHYQLQSMYPAYGGSDWEIIKEKYNIK